jgi:uncharacterized repeat protein (TIGR01451 family)
MDVLENRFRDGAITLNFEGVSPMRRLTYASVTLFCLAGMVAAWVQAQEPGDRRSTLSLPSTSNDAWSVRLAATGQIATGQAANIDRPDVSMLAADTRDLSRLHSVLKSPNAVASPAESPAAASAPAESTRATGPSGDAGPSGDTGVRTASRPVEPLIPSSGSPAGTANNASGDMAVSSRRTYRRPSNPVFDAPPATAAAQEEPKFLSPPSSGGSPVAPELASRPAEAVNRARSLQVTADLPPAASSSLGSLIRVDTLGPSAISVGEEAEFVIRLANSGDIEAAGVQVQVALPESVHVSSVEASLGQARSLPGEGGPAGVLWTVDRLAGHGIQQLTLRVTPQKNESFDLAVDWSLQPIRSKVRVEVQEPKLEIAVNGPSDVEFGVTAPYLVVVSNPGSGPARNVSIDVKVGDEAANTLKVGEIPAGGKRPFEMEVTAQQKGVMEIAARARGDNVEETSASHRVSVRRCELKLEVAGPAMQYAGTVGMYQIRLSNLGDADAQNVQAAVRLPRGVKYLEGLTSAEQHGDTLTWPVGELAPDENRQFQIACELQDGGDLVLQFVGQTGDGLQAAGQVQTRVEAIADLKLAVNDPKGPIRVGRDVVYEIQVVNRGSEAASNVKVVAQFSEGIEPTATEGGTGEIVPGQVIFEPIGSIAPGETVQLKVTAKAERDGNHVFRAAVECSSPETRLVAEDTTQFYGASLQSSSQPPLTPPTGAADPAPRVSNQSVYGNGPQ